MKDLHRNPNQTLDGKVYPGTAITESMLREQQRVNDIDNMVHDARLLSLKPKIRRRLHSRFIRNLRDLSTVSAFLFCFSVGAWYVGDTAMAKWAAAVGVVVVLLSLAMGEE